MSQFNGLERQIASVLQQYPEVKQHIKNIYQRVNYYMYADRDFVYEVAESTELSDAPSQYEVKSSSGERFFGYFDVHPWASSMDKMLLHEIDGDEAKIIIYQHGESVYLTSSSAWNLQQGTRAQWHPDSKSVLLNDVKSGDLIAKEINSSGELISIYTHPIQAVHPDGKEYLSLNYDRLDRNRLDYGYGLDRGSLPDPSSDGMWRVNLESGNDEFLISLQALIEQADTSVDPDNHYVNHALYDPSGERFVFLHRWRGEEGRVSRLYVSDRDGNCRVVMDEPVVSHYCWLSDSELLVWGRTREFGDGYHIIDIDSEEIKYVNALNRWGDGHPSLSPNRRYIITDTYPDRKRQRHLLLYDREEDDVAKIGSFFEPLKYTGTTRCDLHPRWSPDGTTISFDSTHSGRRESYILDVGDLVNQS